MASIRADSDDQSLCWHNPGGTFVEGAHVKPSTPVTNMRLDEIVVPFTGCESLPFAESCTLKKQRRITLRRRRALRRDRLCELRKMADAQGNEGKSNMLSPLASSIVTERISETDDVYNFELGTVGKKSSHGRPRLPFRR